jgi:hypothetical protein
MPAFHVNAQKKLPVAVFETLLAGTSEGWRCVPEVVPGAVRRHDCGAGLE